jgi:hypothetical protein
MKLSIKDKASECRNIRCHLAQKLKFDNSWSSPFCRDKTFLMMEKLKLAKGNLEMEAIL